MNHDKWIELADLYAVGALDGGDASEFHSHLDKGCALCESRIRENESAVTALVQRLPQMEAPAHLKSQIMDSLGAEFEPVSVSAGFSPVWAAAAWVLLSAGIVFGWKQTSLQRHTAEFHRMESAMMAAPGTQAMELKATEQKTPVAAKVVWNQKGECIFITMGLPYPSQGKTYQLWGIVGDQKISAGIFEVDEHGCAVMVLNQAALKGFEKMAVTLEPSGGVPSPTGPMVLLGSR